MSVYVGRDVQAQSLVCLHTMDQSGTAVAGNKLMCGASVPIHKRVLLLKIQEMPKNSI